MQTIDPKGSFAKNLILSLVLIGVTSLVIPLVLKQIDDRKAVDQQRYQDELSRQDTVLDAQANLIDTMAADFWEYELYASDLVISRDPRFGEAEWHRRAVQNYYDKSAPLLGTMRAEISTLLRLAPKSTYDSFLSFYNEDIGPLDACLLELLKHEQQAASTPVAGLPAAISGTPTPATCSAAAGRFTGATWESLADSVVKDELTNRLDRQFAALAEDFRLEGAPEEGTTP
ncbi:MAG: hypothetical protein U0075_20835 [Thermomicrobiales bacterium]